MMLMDSDYYQQLAQQKQLQEQLKIIREAIAKVLDKQARERLANIRLVKPELASQLEIYLFQLIQTGQLKSLSEEQLVKILEEIGRKRQTKIRRK